LVALVTPPLDAPPTAPSVVSTATATEPASAGAEDTDREPEAPGRAERLRLALVGFAGVELYGYGAGARLEIPLFSPLSGTDDSFSLGLELGLGYADVGIDDQGNGYEAFQIPAGAYATWRFGIDDVELAPRVGGALVTSIGGFRGPRLSGMRVALIGMVVVGASVGIRVADGVQIFGSADLTIGPRVGGIFAVGVAL
jgi:hypothetical protein